jgi:glycine cleavage system H protein
MIYMGANNDDAHLIRYTHQHIWLKKVENQLRLGLSEHGQYLLGDIQYVQVTESILIKPNQPIVLIETNKSAVEYVLPFDVTNVKANPSLTLKPQLVNESPEDEGWLCELQPVGICSHRHSLISQTTYEAWLDG